MPVDFNGPTQVKEGNLEEPSEDPQLVYIANNLWHGDEEELIALLTKFEDCFA